MPSVGGVLWRIGTVFDVCSSAGGDVAVVSDE